MAVRWRDPVALRAAPNDVPALHPSRRQSAALLTVLVLVAGTISAVSYLVRPDQARSFALFHGSLLLADAQAPVAVDLASGKPTVRLVNAAAQVGAEDTADLAVVPLAHGTLLLDRVTGEFNMVAATGFVVKHDGGVSLARRRGSTGAVGIPSGDLAYVEQTGPTGTSVYLVGQSTVETASNVDAAVRPRAFRSMPRPGSTAPGAAASADDDLWTLLGAGNRRTVMQLHLPPDSNTGVTLRAVDRGTVDGPAALESASVNDDGSGEDVIGLGSAGGIRLLGPTGTTSRVTYRPVAGADTVLPTSNAQGRLSFLVHGTAGWSAVSVAADGTDLRGPTRLTGIAATASLAPPAASLGSLYTLNTGGGQVVRIDPDEQAGAIDGVDRYPLAEQDGRVVEAGGFGDAYVVARGPRVVVNSPGHLDALVLFTDGSHRPLAIEKSSAVAVSAAGGVEALMRSRAAPQRAPRDRTPSTPATAPPPKQDQVNNRIDCRTTRQKPHIPTIVSAQPGSRSVLLRWTYPLLDPQDCAPSTYQLAISTLSASAPSPPSTVRVQGQQSVNLSGLFPSTQYEITVSAFLNGQGTSSAPRRVTTGPEGPAAPKQVSASTDAAGNWNVSWSSCGSTDQGCVPAASWKVIPEFCDGSGLSGPPAPITVTADPTSVSQPPAQLRGGDALLGRGLRFQVEGTGTQGTVGDPSGFTACTYSWSPPVVSDLRVSASTPPTTSSASTTSTTASVAFAGGRTHDLGGVGGDLTYQLLDAAGTVVARQGPTTAASVTLAGIRPGRSYQVRVIARPPRHPEAAVTTAAVSVQPAIANWPTPSVDATFQDTGVAQGRLLVSFDFPAGTQTHGETFDLNNSALVCGSTTYPLAYYGVRPGQKMGFAGISRFDYNSENSPCRVGLGLVQHAGTLFGAGPSPRAVSAAVDIAPPTLGSSVGDFQAQWAGTDSDPKIFVNYTGSDPLALTSSWRIVATNGTSANCGLTTDPPSPGVNLDVDKSCISRGGTFTVSVSYRYILDNAAFTGIRVSGNAPQPVDPSQVDVSASWSGTAANPAVALHYTGQADRASVAALNWTETVTSGGVTCGTSTDNPAYTDAQVAIDYGACPVTDADGNPATYSVDASFTDPDYGATGDYTPHIDGDPPQ